MKSYEEIYRERSRNILSAIALLEKELRESRTAISANESKVSALRSEVDRLRQDKSNINASQNTVVSELKFLKEQIAALEKQVQQRTKTISEFQSKMTSVDHEIRQRRSQDRTDEEQLTRLRQLVAEKEQELTKAKHREVESRLDSLATLLEDNFSLLQEFLTQQSQREKKRAIRVAYEAARMTDRALMDAHEKLIEIPKLLQNTEAQALRKVLHEELERTKGYLESRFPGILASPSDEEAPELAETYYWHEPKDALSFVLIPLPGQFFETPPNQSGDPRGLTMCRIISAFAEALNGFEPKCEQFERFIVVEMEGNKTSELQEKAAIPVRFQDGKSIDFLLQELPGPLLDAFA